MIMNQKKYEEVLSENYELSKKISQLESELENEKNITATITYELRAENDRVKSEIASDLKRIYEYVSEAGHEDDPNSFILRILEKWTNEI